MSQSDASFDSKAQDNSGNIGTTLNYLLDNGCMAKDPSTMLLICGSFFIMSDVREYFGHPVEVDNL